MKAPLYLQLAALCSSALLASCIPVPIHYTPRAETAEPEIPEQQFQGMVIAPFFHRAAVNDFTDALADTDSEIEVVEAATVFEYAYPNEDPNREVPMHDLLLPEVRVRIVAQGVRFIVVISEAATKKIGEDGHYFGVGIHGSETQSTTLQAAVLDLEGDVSPEHLRSTSEGKDSATWLILPYAGLFIFGGVPDTEESAIRQLAESVAMEIRKQVPKGGTRASVIVGDWGMAERRYKEEQAKQQKELNIEEWTARAKEGDLRAMYLLDQAGALPDEQRAVWIKKIQEQSASGDVDAMIIGLETQSLTNDQKLALLSKARLGGGPERERLDPESAFKVYQALTHHEERLYYLCIAADQHYPAAQYEVGLAYWFGRFDVPEDNGHAFVWLSIAADNGNAEAVKLKPTVARELTRQQKQEAERMLREDVSNRCATEIYPTLDALDPNRAVDAR